MYKLFFAVLIIAMFIGCHTEPSPAPAMDYERILVAPVMQPEDILQPENNDSIQERPNCPNCRPSCPNCRPR